MRPLAKRWTAENRCWMPWALRKPISSREWIALRIDQSARLLSADYISTASARFPYKLSSRHCPDLSATRVGRALHLYTSRTGMGARLNDFALHKPPAPDVEGVRRVGMCSCETAVHRAGWKWWMPYCES